MTTDHPLYEEQAARDAGRFAHANAGLVAQTKAEDAGIAIVEHYLIHADAPNRTAARIDDVRRELAGTINNLGDALTERDRLAEQVRELLANADRGDGPTIDDPDGGLVRALAAAQGTFPPIAKSQTATVRGKDGAAGYTYSYADVADVLAAVRPTLAGVGIAIVQRTYYDAGRMVLVTELRHVAGGILSSTVALDADPKDAQRFGSALTYLRRYELCTLAGVAPSEEDDDAVAAIGRAIGPPEPELPPWAVEASEGRKRAALGALEPLIGREEAVRILGGLKDTIGHLPDVVGYVLGELHATMDRLAESPEARAVAAAQDVAAAQPDAPSPPPAADPPAAPTPPAAPPEEELPPGAAPAAEEPPARMVARPSDAGPEHHKWAQEQNDATLEAAAATLESERGKVHPGYVAAARLERANRKAKADGHTPPDQTPGEQSAAAREAGCRCDDPADVIAGRAEPAADCPVHPTPAEG